jgi:hypothetical protein
VFVEKGRECVAEDRKYVEEGEHVKEGRICEEGERACVEEKVYEGREKPFF